MLSCSMASFDYESGGDTCMHCDELMCQWRGAGPVQALPVELWVADTRHSSSLEGLLLQDTSSSHIGPWSLSRPADP